MSNIGSTISTTVLHFNNSPVSFEVTVKNLSNDFASFKVNLTAAGADPNIRDSWYNLDPITSTLIPPGDTTKFSVTILKAPILGMDLINVEVKVSSVELPDINFHILKLLISSGVERLQLIIRREQKQGQYFTEELGDGVKLDMVLIPGGSFWMGTEDEEIERLCKTYDREWFRAERPQHKVTIPTFFMGRYPITQEQWRIVVGWEQVERKLDTDDPSEFKEDYEGISRWQRPVENISWDDAKEFCNRLSNRTKREYRLPTEAEWEYACRAVTSDQLSVTSRELTKAEWNEKYNQPFHFGETISTELANYRGTDWEYEGKVYPGNYGRGSKGIYREQTTPVEYFKVANNFGLCDMHGNVWEWCEDNWHGDYQGAPENITAWLSGVGNTKVARGGSWANHPNLCRSAYRGNITREDRDGDIGLRVVCVVPRTT